MTKTRANFNAKGLSVNKYARLLGVSHTLLSLILDGKRSPNGKKSQKVIQKLKQDGIWSEQ